MKALLFQVQPTDPLTFAGVSLVLGAGGVAGLLCARSEGIENRSTARAAQRIKESAHDETQRFVSRRIGCR